MEALMALNIDLLRRVQESIADPAKPFCMSCWVTCIAGHTRRVLEEQGERLSGSPEYSEYVAREALGLSFDQAEALFYLTIRNTRRQDAIAAIDKLIAEESRAMGEAGCAASSALASPAQDAKQEEEELVGV
jgi:hypothetical protein